MAQFGIRKVSFGSLCGKAWGEVGGPQEARARAKRWERTK